jgi:hypothetical protein
MPTNSILEDILTGNFSEENYPNLPKKDTIKHVLDDLLLLCNGEHTFLRKGLVHVKCFYTDAKEPKIEKFLQENLDNSHLKNLINFFTQKIGEYQLSEEETKNLISFGEHYNAIYEEKTKPADSKFAEIDIQTTTSFINFLTGLFKQQNIKKFEDDAVKLTGQTLQLSENLIHNINSNYTKESLLDLLKNVGALGFELKIKGFEDLSPKIQSIAYDAIHSNTFNSSEDKELAGYTFLFEFHAGITSEIQSDCKNFLNLKECPKPTANTLLFQRIIHGNYINSKPSFSDFEQIKDEINQNLDNLNHASQFHLFTFLKNILKNNSKSDFDFKMLYGFVFTSINKLTKDLEQQNNLDNSFIQATESLSLFLFNMVKNNVEDRNLYDQIHIIKQFSQFYEKIINHPSQLNNLLDTLNKHFFNMLDRNINRELALQTDHNNFLAIIKDLNKVCRETHNCEKLKLKILARSFKSLGSISRKSNVYKLSTMIETQELINSTKTHLNSKQLSDVISFFFEPNITQNDLNRQCQQTFNLTNCRPASLINLDALETPAEDINNIITTKFTSSTTTPTTPTANTSTISPVVANQTISVNIENPPLTKENNDTNPILANSGLTLAAAAAHGVGSGMLNGIIQYFATKYSRHGEQSSRAKAIAIYSSLLAHAAFATTFPLILYKIQEHINQGNEDEAQELWNNLMLQAPLTFISSIGLNVGLQAAYECTQLLSNRAVRAIVHNTLPLAATAISLFKNPATTAVQIGTSMLSSSLTYLGLNKFFPIEIKSKVNAAKEDVEMNNLSPQTNKTESTRKYQFLSKENLKQVRDISLQLQTSLNTFISSLKESKQNDVEDKLKANTDGIKKEYDKNIYCKNEVISKLIKPSKMVNELHERLMDKDHEKACLVYTNFDEYKKVMETTANVFKLMQSFYETTGGDNLRNALSEATGFISGHKENFSPETWDTLSEIQGLLTSLLSKARSFVSTYNVSDAARKGEQIGEARANLFRDKSNSPDQSEKNQRPFTFNGDNTGFFRNSNSSEDSGHSTSSLTSETQWLIKKS